jgi:hypothetical protein
MQLPCGSVSTRREQRPRRFCLQRQPGQRRPDPVVQVPAQPAPFFLARQHEPLPGALQICAQHPGVQHARQAAWPGRA